MYPASNKFRENIYKGKKVYSRIEVTLADNTSLTFEKNDFAMSNGFKVSSATSSVNTFDIGGVFAKQLDVKLLNHNGDLNDYDFMNAKVVAKIGMDIDNVAEYVKFGTFYVDSQDFNGGIVTLRAFDKLAFMDYAYSGANSGVASNIINTICNKYGLSATLTSMNNASYSVTLNDNNTGYTDREILSYILQVTGNYGILDSDGNFKPQWYNLDALEYISVIDAKSFNDPETEKFIDAGNVANMSSVTNMIDAGTFDGIRSNIGIVNTIFRSKVDIGDVTISGIKVVDDNNTEYTSGTDEYMLVIQNNPFVTSENAQQIAAQLNSVVGGTFFRPINLSVLSNPLYQVGDIVIVELNNNTYTTILTNITYGVGQYTQISCGAESAGKNNGVTYSQSTRAYLKSEREIVNKISEYDLMVKNMNNLIVNSLGFHEIRETQSDGSVIVYLANKPTLAESIGGVVWRIALSVFSVTTNYQGDSTVWQSGFDASGNVVVNILSAIGINFSWAKGGTLTLGGTTNGNGVLKALSETGAEKVVIDKNGITLKNGTTIAWDCVSGKPENIITDGNKSTYITKNYISTLKVIAGSVDAENITGTKISGKTITGGSANFGTVPKTTSADRNYIDIASDGVMSAYHNSYYAQDVPEIKKEVIRFISDRREMGAWVGYHQVGWLGFDTTGEPYFSGYAEQAKSVINTSDKRLKENIVSTDENGLDFIDNLNHIQFDWNDKAEDKGHVKIGYIAQEIEEIDEDCVIKRPNEDLGEMYAVNQTKMFPYLTKAIQELHSIVKDQQAKIQELEERLNNGN